MEKITIAVLFLILTIIALSGCEENEVNISSVLPIDEAVKEASLSSYFTIIDAEFNGRIIYDNETKIIYFYSNYSGVVTPLYNTDGTLKTYQEK